MNIYEKIQRVKKELASRELKKSGENEYSHFKYFELGDFLPSIVELCDANKLFTHISFTNEEGTLTIIDSEKPEDKVEYVSPIRDLELKGANKIQILGGIQTYLRRYLYMAAFDIVEADMFDSEAFETKKKKKAEKGVLDTLIESCKKEFKDANDDIKAQTGNLMKTLGYANFADLAKKQNKNDIISLANRLNVEIPKELADGGEDK